MKSVQFVYLFGLFALLFACGCRNPEQAVVHVAQGVEQNARQATQKAQTAAANRDRARSALAHIPVPTKSLYVDVHEPGAWMNPFISVDADTMTLRITRADANPSTMGQGTLLRPESARRQELQLHLDVLADALIALPDNTWRYGRVIAVAESPLANPKNRPQIRRNIETTIQQLNDLGVVVEEWPAR